MFADDWYHSYASLLGCSAFRFNHHLHLAGYWCIDTAMVVGCQTIPDLLHHFCNPSMTVGPTDQLANGQPTNGPTNQRADILSCRDAIAASKKQERWFTCSSMEILTHVKNAFSTSPHWNRRCVSTNTARKQRKALILFFDFLFLTTRRVSDMILMSASLLFVSPTS